MKIEINKVASAKALNLIRTSPQKMQRAIDISLARAGNEMRNKSIRLAPFKSGTLRRSIRMKQGEDMVRVGTNLIYARIQDQGGVIRPKKAKFLRFKINGRWITTKKVTIPKYKGRGYLTPAYQEQVRGRARKIFTQEINRVLNG